MQTFSHNEGLLLTENETIIGCSFCWWLVSYALWEIAVLSWGWAVWQKWPFIPYFYAKFILYNCPYINVTEEYCCSVTYNVACNYTALCLINWANNNPI